MAKKTKKSFKEWWTSTTKNKKIALVGLCVASVMVVSSLAAVVAVVNNRGNNGPQTTNSQGVNVDGNGTGTGDEQSGNEQNPGGNEQNPGGNEQNPGGNEQNPGGNEENPGGGEQEEQKTEAEYKVECENKLNELSQQVLQNSDRWNTITNVRNLTINYANGDVYGNYSAEGVSNISFFKVSFGSIVSEAETYQDMKNNLDNLNASEVSGVKESSMANSVSQTQLEQLNDYILEQTGLTGATILNTSRFNFDAEGRDVTILIVIDGDVIKTITAKTAAGDQGHQSGKIGQMLVSSANTFAVSDGTTYLSELQDVSASASAVNDWDYMTYASQQTSKGKSTTVYEGDGYKISVVKDANGNFVSSALEQ